MAVAVCIVGAAATAQYEIQYLPAPDPQQLAEEFRATARELPFVVPGDLAYGRESGFVAPAPAIAAHSAATAAARRAGAHSAVLLRLLDDPDPKVRLMAAYGLYRTADVASLPALGAHATDGGEIASLPRLLGETPEEVERARREMPKLGTTTVGAEIAGWLRNWGAPPPGTPAFTAWCARQQELAPTAARLRLAMTFATGGAQSSHYAAQPLLGVWAAVQHAPAGAREIADIALFHDRYQFLGYPDMELTLLCDARRLGRDNVLRFLRGALPVIDGKPLAAESVAGFEDGFARFVLERADAVGLQASDADALLELGRKTDRIACFRGAALLRPASAEAILREAIERSRPMPGGVHDRAACAILLWQLKREQDADFLIEWFHAPGTVEQERTPFVTHLLSSYRAVDRRMFARLVADERFARIDPDALLAIVRRLNTMSFEPLAAEGELMNFHHPVGLERAYRELETVAKTHRVETEKMLATMARWRLAVRERVARWNDAGK